MRTTKSPFNGNRNHVQREEQQKLAKTSTPRTQVCICICVSVYINLYICLYNNDLCLARRSLLVVMVFYFFIFFVVFSAFISLSASAANDVVNEQLIR